MNENIIIVDFGSQVTKLIARRIRDFGVFSQIIPFQNLNEETFEKYKHIKTNFYTNYITMFEKEQLDEHVKNLSEELSNLAPGTMQFGLEAYEKQDAMAFDEALPFLQKQIAKTFEGPDAKEGIAAFLEKRKPDWDK